eukprot:7390312-Prymnesium_polylepis.4
MESWTTCAEHELTACCVWQRSDEQSADGRGVDALVFGYSCGHGAWGCEVPTCSTGRVRIRLFRTGYSRRALSPCSWQGSMPTQQHYTADTLCVTQCGTPSLVIDVTRTDRVRRRARRARRGRVAAHVYNYSLISTE